MRDFPEKKFQVFPIKMFCAFWALDIAPTSDVLVLFFDTPEVTKRVLPKVLQNFKLHLLALENEPKGFFSLTYITGRV